MTTRADRTLETAVAPPQQGFARVQFEDGTVAKPATFRAYRREGKHDLIEFLLSEVNPERDPLNYLKPVTAIWYQVGTPFVGRFVGYIHHIEESREQGSAPQNESLRVVCIGASVVLDQPRNASYTATASQIVRQVAENVKFAAEVTKSRDTVETHVQSGVGTWRFMRDLCHDVGLTLHCDQTTLRAVSRLQTMRRLANTAPLLTSGFLTVERDTNIHERGKPGQQGNHVVYTLDFNGEVALKKPPEDNRHPNNSTKEPWLNILHSNHAARSAADGDDIITGVVEDSHLGETLRITSATAPADLRPIDPICLDRIGRTSNGFWHIIGVDYIIQNREYRVILDLARGNRYDTKARPRTPNEYERRFKTNQDGNRVLVVNPKLYVNVGGTWRSRWSRTEVLSG